MELNIVALRYPTPSDLLTLLLCYGVTLERMISGARYSGVPHSVHVRLFTRFAKPKSVTWRKLLPMTEESEQRVARLTEETETADRLTLT